MRSVVSVPAGIRLIETDLANTSLTETPRTDSTNICVGQMALVSDS